MATYYQGLACLNGHAINSSSNRSPEFNARYCPKCGEQTIDECPKCHTMIRGYCYVEGVLSARDWTVPAHCHECGSAYPWTQRKVEALREALDAIDDLTDGERELLKKSIPDILSETPRSGTASLLFKKAISKMKPVAARVLSEIMTNVAVSTVRSSLGL